MTTLSVLIPTYNRARILEKTLSGLGACINHGFSGEIIVIDNNSADDTVEVVSKSKSAMPVRYVKESRPGKNCALNCAVKNFPLNELVVFLDDDITLSPGAFNSMVRAAAEWPAVDVFGAKIRVGWPTGTPPGWASVEWIKTFGFAWHDLGDEPKQYSGKCTPMGPCYWVRKRVFEKVPAFNESIGPRPTNRIMGSEVSHLLELQRHNFQMVYYPAVEAMHRIESRECNLSALSRRAFRLGRGEVLLYGLHRANLYSKSKTIWWAQGAADFVWSGIRFLSGRILPDSQFKAELVLRSAIRLGKLYQSCRVLRDQWVLARGGGRKLT